MFIGSNNMDKWVAPENAKVADFIICGAMKCGTTTLHGILNKHPKIFIPEKEVNFFDMDDLFQHPDFNHYHEREWQHNDLPKQPEKYWQWYSQKFEGASEDQLMGEDSTTYFASTEAAKRIAKQNKAIKLIVMLRNPVERAYSHYWHLVRTGRATYNFEDTLQFNPFSILNRSMYLQQLENLYKFIPKEQVKVIVFENFFKNKEDEIKRVCQFLDVDHNSLPAGAYDLHENTARTPKFPSLQILKNRLLPASGNMQYQDYFDIAASCEKSALNISKVINALHRKINPLIARKPPLMKSETKTFLEHYFTQQLTGINDVLEQDVMSLWFPAKLD